MRLEATLIYLIGFPGTGKYTVACELSRLTGAKVVDNHYVNNPIFGLIQTDGKTPLPAEVWTQVERVRGAVFDTIRTLSPRPHSFVLTNNLKERDAVDRRGYEAVKQLSEDRGSLFVPVRLLCSADELSRRIVSQGRAERLKETDPEAARKRFARETVLKPDAPTALMLDVTALSAEEAAQAILRHIGGLVRDLAR